MAKLIIPNPQPAIRNLHTPGKAASGTVHARAERGRVQILLAAWLIVPVLLFTWEWTEVVAHYFIPLMPAAYLLPEPEPTR